MGGFVKRGGYVVTTPEKKYVSNAPIDQRKLHEIAALLGIKPDDRDQMKVITTIFIDAAD